MLERLQQVCKHILSEEITVRDGTRIRSMLIFVDNILLMPLGLTGARKLTQIQHLIRDTPQGASTPVNGTMSCQEDIYLCGSPAHMLALKTKYNTHRSILSDEEHESSVVSMLARAVQYRTRKHVPFIFVEP